MTINIQQPSRKTVLFSYMRMFLYSIGIVVVAIVTAYTMNIFYPLPFVCIRICEYFGYVSWGSVLGALGWEIQTWEGNSSAERLNKNLTKILSIIGTFAFVLARELIPAA